MAGAQGMSQLILQALVAEGEGPHVLWHPTPGRAMGRAEPTQCLASGLLLLTTHSSVIFTTKMLWE